MPDTDVYTTQLEISFLQELPKLHAERLGRPKLQYSPAKLYELYLDSMCLRTDWGNIDRYVVKKECVKRWSKASRQR